MKWAFALFTAVVLFPALAAAENLQGERQNLASIRTAVEQHLQRETRGLPGSASFTVGAIDPRLALPACPQLDTFPAPGARAFGNTSVGVRCAAPAWSIFVPATVRVVSEYVIAARALAQGQEIRREDLSIQRGDLAQLPAGVVTAPEAALGRIAAGGVIAGQPLRRDMLRLPLLIQQGQAGRLVSRGKGFQVSADGHAVTNAHDGQVVQVRTPAGQVVSGIARPGPLVEVAPGG